MLILNLQWLAGDISVSTHHPVEKNVKQIVWRKSLQVDDYVHDVPLAARQT